MDSLLKQIEAAAEAGKLARPGTRKQLPEGTAHTIFSFKRIFKPNNVAAGGTCEQDVRFSIAVHIDDANVVGPLFFTNDLPGEASLAVIDVDHGVSVRAGFTANDIQEAVSIQISDGQTMRAFDFRIDLNPGEFRSLEPDYALSENTTSHEVHVPVVIEIANHDVRSSFFLV